MKLMIRASPGLRATSAAAPENGSFRAVKPGSPMSGWGRRRVLPNAHWVSATRLNLDLGDRAEGGPSGGGRCLTIDKRRPLTPFVFQRLSEAANKPPFDTLTKGCVSQVESDTLCLYDQGCPAKDSSHLRTAGQSHVVKRQVQPARLARLGPWRASKHLASQPGRGRLTGTWRRGL